MRRAMTRLFALVLVAFLAVVISTVCYGAVVMKLFRNEGWLKGLLGLVFPPYAFVWGWLHERTLPNGRSSFWMSAWTCAATLLTLGIAFLQLQMG
jgi:hypothetical protein